MAARAANMADHALGGVVRRVAERLTADSYRDLTDRELLERFVQQHDESAFEALVRRHQRCVYAALNKVLSDPADMEDAFQATFLVLVRKASSVRWQEGLGTWLYAVAHRVAVHARSTTLVRLRHEEQAASQARTTAAAAELTCREACDAVHEELERLPERLRLPLLLCYLEGKSRDEAAGQLGVSVGTVKGRLERGRNLLRQRLRRRGVPLTAGLLVLLAHSAARASSPGLVQATVAAVSGPSARVAALARGVTASMILNKVKLMLGLLVLVGLLGALGSRLVGRAPSAAAQAEKTPPAKPAVEDKEDPGDVVSGRVVDESGKPIAGAKLSLFSGKGKPRQAGETGKDGRFRVKLGKDTKAKLIARVSGRGLDWIDLGSGGRGEVILRLDRDVAIQGRVRDLEGRAVVGARVTVTDVSKSNTGNLDAYMDAWKNVNRGVSIPDLPWLPPAALGVSTATTTGKDGRFRLEGFGRERLVEVVIQGAAIERRKLWAVTRPGLKKMGSFHGPTIELLVGPGKEMVGTVKEKGTGRPIAGAEVTCQTDRVRTDEQGRFRFEGLKKEPRYLGWVSGPGFFTQRLDVKDTPGRDAVRADVEIQRGTYVSGQLRDRATGKPVSGVVRYYVKPDNPNVKKYALFLHSMGWGLAGSDGKFRVLAIPGPGFLAVQADQNRYTRATVPDWKGEPLAAVPYPVMPYNYHAIVSIEPDEKKPASLKYGVEVDSGLSKSGSVVDADGKPLAGVVVFGLTAIPDPARGTIPRPSRFGPPPPSRLKTASFTAVGLNPKEPRHLVFLHPEKKLGKVLLIRGDEKGPLLVKLEALGAVSGRVLTENGKPAVGLVVISTLPTRFAYYRDYPIELLTTQRFAKRRGSSIHWLPEPVKTDAEGKFRLAGLLPGLKYRVMVRDAAAGGINKEIVVEAGKTKDLGEIKRER
jgi:RNA polymerase sigma factor (sigma-70 family)